MGIVKSMNVPASTGDVFRTVLGLRWGYMWFPLDHHGLPVVAPALLS